jgi:hypothetical protein
MKLYNPVVFTSFSLIASGMFILYTNRLCILKLGIVSLPIKLHSEVLKILTFNHNTERDLEKIVSGEQVKMFEDAIYFSASSSSSSIN